MHTDSPMAIKAVHVFLKHEEEFSDETKAQIKKFGSPLHWPNFHFDNTQDDSKKINEVQISVHHRVFQRHGCRRPRAASPGAAPA